MIVVERTDPAGRLRSTMIMETKGRIGAALAPRSGRSEAKEPRSGLTATLPMWPPTDMKPVWAQQPGCLARSVGSPELFTRKPYAGVPLFGPTTHRERESPAWAPGAQAGRASGANMATTCS